MNYLKLFLAFGLGWVTVVVLTLGADAEAGRGEPEGDTDQSALQGRVSALQERVVALEDAARLGRLSEKVVAPFEVVNRAGQRLFYVSPDRDVEVYKGNKRVASMSAGGDFGTLWVSSDSSQWWTTLNPEGIRMNDNGQTRMELGRAFATRNDTKGNYRLRFYSGAGKTVAGIGVAYETNAGSVIISKPSGEQRAGMSVTEAGRGLVQVVGGYGNPVARLIEADSKGGLLLICNASNCDPPMVSAGDENELHVGLVATGPHYYQPGLGLTGVPGSFLLGKKQ